MEGIWAAKGYAVVIPDFIGYGITSGRIHPYMHAESTARSALDMALAVKPYLKHIGREPESEQVILAGFSQGAAGTLALMEMIQNGYESVLPIKKVYAGSGPYDLATTCDLVLERERSNLPCAIPMLVQGLNAAENLGIQMSEVFQPLILNHFDDWINSKAYTVREINAMIGTHDLKEIMTEKGRDKNGQPMSMLYQSLQRNSLLRFTPRAPLYLFHSHQDQMVPFVNALKAQEYFKDNTLVQYDFGDYSLHGISCCYFLLKVFKDL
jgi:pimeloyl-ACP methyl ester carboxylesterase